MPTIEEAKKRIAEIKKQRDELREEQNELEKIISDDSQAKRLAARKEYEGKYFLLKDNIARGLEFNGIAGFKILKVDSTGSLSQAECIVLIEGRYYNNYWITGIIKDRIWLWTPITPCRLRLTDEPNLIEYYQEVTREEFLKAAAAHSLIDEI